MAAGSTVRSCALMEVLYNAFQLRWQHSWTRHRQYLSIIEPETTRRDARSCAAAIITIASVSCSFFICCCCCWCFVICAISDTVFIDQKERRKAIITGDIYNKSNGLWRRISPLEDLEIRAKTIKSGRRYQMCLSYFSESIYHLSIGLFSCSGASCSQAAFQSHSGASSVA